jgi:hypothetical protein
MTEQRTSVFNEDRELANRFFRASSWGRKVRSSEYHITHACNIRCKGCWFFEFGFDTKTGKDVTDPAAWRAFAEAERKRGVTMPLLIGGEPTLVLDRVRAFIEHMPYVTISSNGIKPVPRDGFENVSIGCTLFGGGPLDDELRGHSPSGKPMTGLFQTALANYRNDDRVTFVYAVTPESLPHVEQVVAQIRDNGNKVLFNYYTGYSDVVTSLRSRASREAEVLDRLIAVKEAYPEVVLSHPYYLRALITGKTHFGTFGYDTCPSVSASYAGNAERIGGEHPVIPGFEVYAPDLKTVNKCCTSGECTGCRDSQAVMSWLMVSARHFVGSTALLRTWVEIAESFWKQFCWSPYHPRQALAGAREAVTLPAA